MRPKTAKLRNTRGKFNKLLKIKVIASKLHKIEAETAKLFESRVKFAESINIKTKIAKLRQNLQNCFKVE